MLFEFEDKALIPLEEKVRAKERLSFEDGVTLWNSFDNPTNICSNSYRCFTLIVKLCVR